MKFLDTGEKIRKLRKELNIKQEELNVVGVSRNFISMIENGKRKLPDHVAVAIADIFKNKAAELGIKLDIDGQWLMISAKEQATNFCNEKLKCSLSTEDVDIMTALVKEYEINDLKPEVYTLKANKLYDNRSYEEAFTYYYEILDQLQNDTEEKAFIYNKLAKCKIMMINYIEALIYLSKCYEYSILNKNTANRKKCLYNMALCYQKLDSIDLALNCIDNYIKLCDISVEFKDFIGAVILKSNCYILSKKYQEAVELLSDVITKFDEPTDLLLGYVYNSLGVLYLELNNLDESLTYLDKAAYIREQKDSYNFSHTIINKAKVLLKKKMKEEALILINKAVALAEQYNDYELIIEGYELLESLYREIESNAELIDMYPKMICYFNKMKNAEESLKIYIKLLSVVAEAGDNYKCKEYLKEAMKLM